MSPQTAAYRWAVQALVSVLGGGSLLMGVALVVGGNARFTSSAFAIAAAVPWSPYSWGFVIATAGILALLGAASRRPALMRCGLFAAAVWFLFFDLSLIAAAAVDPHLPLTGSVVYALISALCLVAWGASKELRGSSRPPRP